MSTSDDENNEEADANQDTFDDEYKDKNNDAAGDDKVDEGQIGDDEVDEGQAVFTSLVSSLEIENSRLQPRQQQPSVSFIVRMVYAWWMETERHFKAMIVISILVMVSITIQTSKYRPHNSVVVVLDPDDRIL
jgi:hypothetical protein